MNILKLYTVLGRFSWIGVALCSILLLASCDSTPPETTTTERVQVVNIQDLPVRTVRIDSADTIFALFEELHYTNEEWAAGNRIVPRLYMAGIPSRWQETNHKLVVAKKKELFFRLLAPLVLHANGVIKQDRQRLLNLGDGFAFDSLSKVDREWLLQLAMKYKVIKAGTTILVPEDMVELRLRVDVIPVSLALAQGAEESGWGTSRFAVLGNSLFGQWDFSGKGIRPERQRKELGDYGLARFDTPLDSVISYMLNLNTHRAYRALRQYRASMRQKKEAVSGYELASKLDKYSERGLAYVDGLHAIMRVNNLAHTDKAHLGGNEIIYLVHKEP